MTKSSNDHLQAMHREALEARFASRVRARLDAGTDALPHDITERLRIARTQAVAAARDARLAAEVSVISASSVTLHSTSLQLAGTAGTSSGSPFATGLHLAWPQWLSRFKLRARTDRPDNADQSVGWGWRLACAGPVVALVLGLWGIQQYQHIEHVEATTKVDMALLVDDLPPDAYADPGFQAYLNMIDNDPDLEDLVNAPPEISGDLLSVDPPASVKLP